MTIPRIEDKKSPNEVSLRADDSIFLTDADGTDILSVRHPLILILTHIKQGVETEQESQYSLSVVSTRYQR